MFAFGNCPSVTLLLGDYYFGPTPSLFFLLECISAVASRLFTPNQSAFDGANNKSKASTPEWKQLHRKLDLRFLPPTLPNKQTVSAQHAPTSELICTSSPLHELGNLHRLTCGIPCPIQFTPRPAPPRSCPTIPTTRNRRQQLGANGRNQALEFIKYGHTPAPAPSLTPTPVFCFSGSHHLPSRF